MDVRYRESFVRDLKKLKKYPVYGRIRTLAFETLPAAESLLEGPGIVAMKGHPGRYRIRIGVFRVGVEAAGGRIEVVRVLDRRDFYRYFP